NSQTQSLFIISYVYVVYIFFFFFFQAEDGIRDKLVTGVQTCALPIVHRHVQQWMWRLQHAEGKQEINELHVPVDRAVELTMTSQDVIHSFFVPAFRLHQDVVPG